MTNERIAEGLLYSASMGCLAKRPSPSDEREEDHGQGTRDKGKDWGDMHSSLCTYLPYARYYDKPYGR